MAYDASLAQRVREAVGPLGGVSERAMFGGLAFLLDGKMFCGVTGDRLMVRVGRAQHEAALMEPHVRPMDFTGRPMKGYVFVQSPGIRTTAAVKRWVGRGFEEVKSSSAPRPTAASRTRHRSRRRPRR